MPTLANSQVAPPKSWDEFEDIVCSAAKLRWENPDFTRHGRQGQKQDGVDVYGNNDKGETVGLQCKNTWGGVSQKSIEEEIKNAESFKPTLVKLYIATTAPTDKTTQAFVRSLSLTRESAGGFGVEILFWNDVWHDLTLDERRVYQHFPHLRPKSVMKQQEPSHDQQLFKEFQSVFSYEPTVRLLRDHDFGGPFYLNDIQPLHDFVSTWDQPEKEFLDKELQAALSNLFKAARIMSEHLCEKTVPIGNGNFASVFSDVQRAMGPRPKWVIEDARVLNEQASQFVPIYENFLRLCREKLEQ